jgi:gliding motility-associated lipoprotein GldH
MKKIFTFFILAAGLSACDGNRVYDQVIDFEDRQWRVTDQPVFEFNIPDTAIHYDLYCNLRNSVSYPYSRLFINYYLEDSTGTVLQKKMTHVFLFDSQTGKPQGSSGLGDIYDHRIPLLNKHHFPYSGKYKMKLEQYMRTDSLQGVLAVGLRVEKNLEE